MLHVDRLNGFLCCCSVLGDALDYRSHIVDFYVWWTQNRVIEIKNRVIEKLLLPRIIPQIFCLKPILNQ